MKRSQLQRKPSKLKRTPLGPATTDIAKAARDLLDAIEHARTTTDPVEWTFRDDDVEDAKRALRNALDRCEI